MKKFYSHNEAETIEIAKEFAKNLRPGDIVALKGELGAGKTAFVKGVAEHFGTGDVVNSPTFTIVNEYDGNIKVYHFDAYRLENVSEDNCDWLDDYFFSDGICLIEWAENIINVLPKGYIAVYIDKDNKKGTDYREVTIC